MSLAATTSSVPWWYVAVLAGGFTLLGALLSQLGSWLTSRRKNKLDDSRRFDGDIIAAYIRIDEIANLLQPGDGDGNIEVDESEFEALNREVMRISTRLQLIAPESVSDIVSHIEKILDDEIRPDAPLRDPTNGLISLVIDMVKLRRVIRRELRVTSTPQPKVPTSRTNDGMPRL